MREPWTPSDDPALPSGGTEILAQSLRETLEGLGVFAGGIYLVSPDEPTLVLTMLAGWPRDFVKPWERMSLSYPGPVSDTLRNDSPTWVRDSKEWVRRYPHTAVAMPYEFAIAAFPVSDDTTDYGVLFALWPGAQPEKLSPHDHDHLQKCADLLARRLGAAPEPVRPGPGPLFLRPAFDGSAEAFAARLPEGLCALDLQGHLTVVNPAGAELLGESAERLVGTHPWRVLPWLNDPAYEDQYRAAVISQKPTSFVALRPPDQWLSFRLHPDPTGITVRIAPARPAHDGPAAPADDAGTDALPVEPVRLGAIYHVVQLAATLTAAVGVRDVVDLVADQIMPAFGGQALALLTAEDGRLRVAGSRGYPPHAVRALDRTPLTAQTPGIKTLLAGVPSFFESAGELYEAYPLTGSSSGSVLRGTMSAWAFLPLIASGKPVGVCVLAFEQPHVFTPEDRNVLTSLGGLIAQALERARLYDSTNELARGLQSALLPHALPRVPGLNAAARYLPGTKGMDIGGDFYDLIPLGEGAIAAVIGDVQGHNVTAAALMGQARTAVRAYAATSDGDPGQVLERVNRLLTELDTGLFASCVYLHLDLAGGEARIARAGHPQPLLRHPDGRTEVLDIPGGLVLGVEADARYPHVRIPLPPDSVLALYTDGLIEKPGIDLDDALAELAERLALFGDQSLEGLADILARPARLAGHRADDVAVLLLRPTAARP
ncbi:SpoIIE family protein phosphatase [Actinorugispora endophytica]|uniref:SpoIIE family protein phosphatase n=1 Tax=Actinorugispora endophytica TaxID=1605990 RepID=UPI001FB68549|nr:SpoIIE family protein phosphatase [Actinorugispora endophytica]